MILKEFFFLVRDSIQAWSRDRASRQAAALAYYSIFAVAPMIALVTLIVGRLLRNWVSVEEVLEELLVQISTTLDPQTADTIAGVVASFLQSDTGVFSTLVSLGIMLFAASGLLTQLQQSLDVVWHVAPDPERGPLGIVKDRALAIGFIGLLGLLLMASFVVSTLLTTGSSFLTGYLASSATLSSILDPEILQNTARLYSYVDTALSFVLLTIIFALVFKVLPRVSISWRDVWVGALVTAVLFIIGIKLIGFYLSRSSTSSAFGAAGSLVLILVWVYYSAQIFLFGAEFTKVYANRYGSQIRPDEGAIYRVPVTALPPPATQRERALQPAQPAPETVDLQMQSASAQLPERAQAATETTPDYAFHFGWLLASVVALFLGIILGGQRRR